MVVYSKMNHGANLPVVVNRFRLRLYFLPLLRYGSILDFGIRILDFEFRNSNLLPIH